MLGAALAAGLLGCDPYAAWPEQEATFPWGVPPEPDLEPYEEVRVETETWTPLEDLEQTLLYIQKSVEHRPGAHRQTVLHFGEMRARLPALVPGDTRLSFVGDVMRIDGNWSTFADGAASRLDGDLRLGNLETPTSDAHPTDPGQLASEYGVYAFNSPTSLLDGLPLDVLQLNNNHALDLGDEGLERTIAAVEATGRFPLGIDGAFALADLDGARIALLSYTWGTNVDRSGSAHDLHVVPFGHLDEPIALDAIRDDVRGARDEGADLVVLMLHWGYEYEYYPDPHFLRLGRRLVELGADLVVGSGPHTPQPPEICDVNRPLSVPGPGRCSVRDPFGRPRTAAILYSLGNFGTELATIPLQVGLVASVSIGAGGVTGLGWEAVASVPTGGGQSLVPLADLLADPAYTAEAARLDQLLGTRWKR